MNFEFYNPTRLIFGAGNLKRLGKEVKRIGRRALLVTGGGSVKRNGIFDRAVASLEREGITWVECAGIEPNPRITSVARGAQLVRDEKCEVVIALGGGSTMDASKVIGAAALYDGEPWDLIGHGQQDWVIPTETLPVVTVPTLAATGSEMNCGAVISNDETKIKSFVQTEALYPAVALVDPELTLTVPKDQTAYGICDIIVHVTEAYFNGIDDTPVQDRFAEGVILNTIDYGKRALADGNDLEARTHLQWASILALNGFMAAGMNPAGFPVHMIEHAISAHHDITHGAGLAIVNPAWMRFAAKVRPAKFVQFGERIFNLKPKGSDDMDCALAGIDAYEAFLKSIGCPTRLSALGIGDELFTRYAEDSALVLRDEDGNLLGRPTMSKQDIVEVLRSAL
ncbi:iron-containing alcohol dehydrogenase [Desulforhopalus singaporensis]|uniref:Uncharacterized protein n=1 Tax=Desulforhopalus singaporensis TaxID=91360 RepID=A0A1H0PRM2_9BACT|nr:iron-containing alcohol dehydrogenase [Desulforhopalus singaporensis]SDP07791.1 hypothetical protein SAMN05660330_01738 [Desulforhopalus singaporensis]